MKTNQAGFSTVEGLLIVGAVLVASLVGWYVLQAKSSAPTASKNPTATKVTPKQSTVVSEVKPGVFRGTITDDECARATIAVGDVGCFIVVGNVRVVVRHGNTAPTSEWGDVTGILTNDRRHSSNGKEAEVYAKEIDGTNYTLQGSSQYYLKVLN